MCALQTLARESQESLSGWGRCLLGSGGFPPSIYMFFPTLCARRCSHHRRPHPTVRCHQHPPARWRGRRQGAAFGTAGGRSRRRSPAGCRLRRRLRPGWERGLPRVAPRRRRQVALWSQGRRRRRPGCAPRGPATSRLGPCPPPPAAGGNGTGQPGGVAIDSGAYPSLWGQKEKTPKVLNIRAGAAAE